MSNKLKQYIEDLILTVKKDQPIFSIRWNDAIFWVKHPQLNPPTFWHRVQRILNILIPLDIIRSTIQKNPSRNLDHEIQRLNEFEMKEMPAPRIKALSNKWVCMSDVGSTLHSLLERRKCKKTHLLKAAETLANFHDKGCYHGRAKLNDLTLMDNSTIGFIDFEENALRVMSLTSAQNRDLYLFISSLCRWDPAIAEEALQTYLKTRAAEHSYKTLKQLLWLLKPIKLLFPFTHKMSKDLRQAYFAQKIFEKLL